MRVIYENRPGADVQIIEPALLREPSSGVEREVDILLETTTKEAPIRIAIECRDRSRRDDLQWIDALIGKYADLPVDKVIAVSRNGFTAPAVRKAEKHRIQAISFERVRAIDWPGEFKKLGVMLVTTTTDLKAVNFQTEPALPGGVALDAPVIDREYGEVGTVEEVFGEVFKTNIAPGIRDVIRRRYFEIYKVVADLDKLLYVEVPVNLKRDIFVKQGSDLYQIKRVTFKTLSANKREDRPVEHFRFGGALISIGRFDEGEFAQPLVAVQLVDPGNPEEIRLLTTGVTRTGQRQGGPSMPEG